MFIPKQNSHSQTFKIIECYNTEFSEKIFVTFCCCRTFTNLLKQYGGNKGVHDLYSEML